MEESIAERLRVQDRMIEAARAQKDDSGWVAQVMPAGLKITYTWHGKGAMGLDFYTVEAFVPWATLAHASQNPLLAVMDELTKQKKEFNP